MTGNNNDRCCLPYNDGLMVGAQIISFFALLLSWTTMWSLIIGVVTWLLLQIVWCCRMRRCGLITTGIMAVISGAACITAAILVLVNGTSTICNSVAADSNDDVTNADDFQDNCTLGLNVYVGLAFGAGALWLITALLLFMFTCGERYDKFHLPM